MASTYSPVAQPPLPPHLDPRGKHRGRRAGAVGTGPRVLLTVMTLLSVSLLVVAGYYWATYRHINSGVHRLNLSQVGKAPSGGVTESTPAGATVAGVEQNILLIGIDNRTDLTSAEKKLLHAGESGGDAGINTDTMMVVHIPADGKHVTLISLPRDTYVHIKGYGMDRLNSAYAYGFHAAKGNDLAKQQAGASLLIDTIGGLTGLTINHYVQVDLLGFYRLAQALNGIPVTLCQNVDDSKAANQQAGLPGGSGFKLSKGKHTLNAVQALQFVRQRHFVVGGDLGRVRRQQYFLSAAFREVASVGILTKLNSLGDALTRSIVVDQNLNLLDLGRQLQNLTSNNIVGRTIPTNAETVDGKDVLVVNTTKVHKFISGVLNPAPAKATSSAAKGSGATSSAKPKAAKPSGVLEKKCVN